MAGEAGCVVAVLLLGLGEAVGAEVGGMRHVRSRPLRQPSGHRSDHPCPRPKGMRRGLSGAVQRPEDSRGMRGREALSADGVEQAHSEIPSM